MARKKLETILKMEDSQKKANELFSFILRSLPHSQNWKEAKREWEKLKKKGFK